MEGERSKNTRALAERVVALAEELEVSGEVSIEEAELKRDRDALHAWIDTAVRRRVDSGFRSRESDPSKWPSVHNFIVGSVSRNECTA